MATKKLQLKDFQKTNLKNTEAQNIKGGYSFVIPGSTGSSGYINWDDVEIREDGLMQLKAFDF